MVGAKQKSRRSSEYILYGVHAVQAALNNKKRRKGRLFVTKDSCKKLKIPAGIKPYFITTEQLAQKFSANIVHQSVALEVQPLNQPILAEILELSKPVLMLDQVSDPHNVGAILRSAAAFGVSSVIMQDKHAPAENATIAKSAAGALEIVPIIHVTNLARALRECKQSGYWCVGMDHNTEKKFSDLEYQRKTVIVLGAEGRGLRRLVAQNCDEIVKLPIDQQMESLNVSVAAGIALYALQQKLCYS